MNEIPDDEGRRLSERFTAAASKLTPASHSLAEIQGLVQRRRRRRRITRIATITGAAAAVVAVVLTVNAVTGPTASHPVVPVQSVTPSPSPSPTPTPTTAPSSPPPSALVPPTFQTHPSSGTASPESSDSGALEASVLKQISLPGSGADAIAIDSGLAYVVNGGASGTVELLDLTTDVVGKSIAVGSTPIAVAVDPVLHTAYVVNSGAGTVSVINKASASVVATVTVGKKPVAIAVDSTRHVTYVANSGSNTVSIIDETTNTVAATVNVGQGPLAVAVDATTHTVYVANANSGQGSISKIDGVTHHVMSAGPLAARPLALAIDSTHNTLYICTYRAATNDSSNPPGGWLWAMDEKTLDTPAQTKITPGPASPVSSVLDAAAHMLYVVAPSNVAGVAGRLLVLQSPDNFLGDPPFVPVGTAPKAVAVDPATHDLYVVNGDNTITLVAGVDSSSPA